MKKNHFLVGTCLLSFFQACAPKASESNYLAATTDSTIVAIDTTPAGYVCSSAAKSNKDPERKFIRTADLKFKVKSVIKSTYNIEDIVVHLGGFVIYTNLASEINNTDITPISADSSLETTYYTVHNTMTLRIPNTALDTTLKSISKNIDFLNYRTIKADDVALQILSNNLAIRRSTKNESRLAKAINNRGKKLVETTVAEEVLVSKEEKADNARISNLSLTSQVNFSTINIEMYQQQTVKRELIANNENIKPYEPGFGLQILDSLKFGWNMLESLCVFLIKLWGLYIIAILGFIGYKLYKKNKK